MMYLDSAILVKLVVREPDSLFYAQALSGKSSTMASELAMTECRSALLRKQADGQIDPATLGQAWIRLQALWTSGGLTLHPVTRSVLAGACKVLDLCREHVPLRTLDAIHLATALESKASPLMTNDKVMRAAAKRLGIPLGELPG